MSSAASPNQSPASSTAPSIHSPASSTAPSIHSPASPAASSIHSPASATAPSVHAVASATASPTPSPTAPDAQSMMAPSERCSPRITPPTAKPPTAATPAVPMANFAPVLCFVCFCCTASTVSPAAGTGTAIFCPFLAPVGTFTFNFFSGVVWVIDLYGFPGRIGWNGDHDHRACWKKWCRWLLHPLGWSYLSLLASAQIVLHHRGEIIFVFLPTQREPAIRLADKVSSLQDHVLFFFVICPLPTQHDLECTHLSLPLPLLLAFGCWFCVWPSITITASAAGTDAAL